MRYLGGKHTIGREIASFLHSVCPEFLVSAYLEPFCGSLGVFKHMTSYSYSQYIAGDLHADLIALWVAVQNGTFNLPIHISKDEYLQWKLHPTPHYMRAVCGFGLSFGGKWFGSYIQTTNAKRNYLDEFSRSIKEIASKIQRENVSFHYKSYDSWEPQNMLI